MNFSRHVTETLFWGLVGGAFASAGAPGYFVVPVLLYAAFCFILAVVAFFEEEKDRKDREEMRLELKTTMASLRRKCEAFEGQTTKATQIGHCPHCGHRFGLPDRKEQK